jgi:hypothetical protein
MTTGFELLASTILTTPPIFRLRQKVCADAGLSFATASVDAFIECINFQALNNLALPFSQVGKPGNIPEYRIGHRMNTPS